jgi:hypothetical protein
MVSSLRLLPNPPGGTAGIDARRPLPACADTNTERVAAADHGRSACVLGRNLRAELPCRWRFGVKTRGQPLHGVMARAHPLFGCGRRSLLDFPIRPCLVRHTAWIPPGEAQRRRPDSSDRPAGHARWAPRFPDLRRPVCRTTARNRRHRAEPAERPGSAASIAGRPDRERVRSATLNRGGLKSPVRARTGAGQRIDLCKRELRLRTRRRALLSMAPAAHGRLSRQRAAHARCTHAPLGRP